MTNENEFCGTFRTLEKLDGSDTTELVGKVRGMVNGKLFVFNVFWPDGHSSTVWTGQCHKPCDMGFWSSDRYTLHATWIDWSGHFCEKCRTKARVGSGYG
uniref:Uncharacterized protein n=1 Tax=Romanomermis culicivorax TaxID=13658 RepID=A0A915L7I9_ROMCU